MKKRIKKFNTCIIKKCWRDNGSDSDFGLVEAERELAVESLKAHLSEQRHDFFNLLQVLYGYTQLKKPDKVMTHIKDYCRQMENIGRLYNCKCIKLADLLYTKGKEAESLDLKVDVCVDVSFDPIVRMLDDAAILYALEHVLSVFSYALDSKGCKNTHIDFVLKEEQNFFHIEIYCRELREGQLEAISMDIPEPAVYWKKIEKGVMCIDKIIRHCRDNCYDAGMTEDGATFVLDIHKVL